MGSDQLVRRAAVSAGAAAVRDRMKTEAVLT
jgi:hypothetical protein